MSAIAFVVSENLPLQNPVAELEIPTATAVVVSASNPNLVLIGDSDKHELPVLPGGKIDLLDQVHGDEFATAENCIRREIREEIGAEIQGLKFLFKHSNPKGDNRLVKVSSLRGTVVDAQVAEYQDNDLILGKYGVPDYIYLVVVDPQKIENSSELKWLRWIDCNSADAKNLGADGSFILKMYSQIAGEKSQCS